MQIEEGDYVLIRAKVARASDEMALVEIEYARDAGRPTPFTLVVERASIAAVELREPAESSGADSVPPWRGSSSRPVPPEWLVTFIPEATDDPEMQRIVEDAASHFWFRRKDMLVPITMTAQEAFDRGLLGGLWPHFEVSS